MMRASQFVFALFIVCCAVTLNAQTPLHRVHGTGAFDRYGSSLCEVGDLNADGAPEFAVGTALNRVDIVDGSSGLVHFSVTGLPSEDFGYDFARMGDVDGDGVPDFAVGAPAFSDPTKAGRVEVFSGATSLSLYVISGIAPGDRFGLSVVARDLTGDGVKDLVIGAPGRDIPVNDAGEVSLHDGVTGTRTMSFSGTQNSELFGNALAIINDVNGDPFPDIVVGAPGGNPPFVGSFFGGTGEVQILSGANFSSLLLLQGASGEDSFGADVTITSDLDRDGRQDIVVGIPGLDEGVGADVGAIQIFGSVSGRLIKTFVGREAGERFGETIENLRDVNASGYWDVAVGSPTYGEVLGGRVVIIEPQSGRVVSELISTAPLEGLGRSIAMSSGYGRDKEGEFYVGATGSSSGGIFSGEVKSYSFGRGLYGAKPLGNVGLGSGGPYAILRVNGQTSKRRQHIVKAKIGAPFSVGMRQVPTALGPNNFVIFGVNGIPMASEGLDIPGVGVTTVIPCDAVPALQPQFFVLADTAGFSACMPVVSATPTPWRATFPAVNFPFTWTLQGIVEVAPGVLELTNAVVLDVAP